MFNCGLRCHCARTSVHLFPDLMFSIAVYHRRKQKLNKDYTHEQHTGECDAVCVCYEVCSSIHDSRLG